MTVGCTVGAVGARPVFPAGAIPGALVVPLVGVLVEFQFVGVLVEGFVTVSRVT